MTAASAAPAIVRDGREARRRKTAWAIDDLRPPPRPRDGRDKTES
jgi:hypothetical protein